MLRKATETSYFEKKREKAQNPYIGFTSFQHFRGEKLYSDLVVRPENNMTETEHVEGYPVPDYVQENGREEGYYPDTTVAYLRIFWKDFEPVQGEYNYAFIEDILEKARSKGQTVMFRLMAHSTRESDDVPDWLKEIIECPARPTGKRVKDSPKDPRFLTYFGAAVKKIAERFDKDPTFDCVDISLPGAWGEGSDVGYFTEEQVKELVDIYTHNFKNTRLIGQVCAPWLVNYANETANVGWRGDGTGEDAHMHVSFPTNEKQMSDVWMKAPVSFESFWWLGEWMRKGWDIDEIIQLTLGWHISTFNAKSLPIPYEWKEKVDYWVSKMGYHFAVDYFKYPESASAADHLELKIGIDNYGVAPIYNALPLHIRLINEEASYVFSTDVDIREWLPGKHGNMIHITLPENISSGKYQIEVGIGSGEYPEVYLCTDAAEDGAYYVMGEIEIVAVLS